MTKYLKLRFNLRYDLVRVLYAGRWRSITEKTESVAADKSIFRIDATVVTWSLEIIAHNFLFIRKFYEVEIIFSLRYMLVYIVQYKRIKRCLERTE